MSSLFFFFFFNDTATTEIYTLSLHDALPISAPAALPRGPAAGAAAHLRPRDGLRAGHPVALGPVAEAVRRAGGARGRAGARPTDLLEVPQLHPRVRRRPDRRSRAVLAEDGDRHHRARGQPRSDDGAPA